MSAGIGATLMALALLATAVHAEGEAEPEPAGVAAISPGQEELILAMLGKDASLPGACELTDGQIEYDVITATYTCRFGVVVLDVTHPTQAEPGATETEQFAVAVDSGSPPENFTDAVAAVIHAHEGKFEWTWNTDESDDADQP